MQAELFRRQVREARQTEWLGAIGFQAPRYGWLFAGCAIACLVAMGLLLTFGRFTRHERAEGALIPSGGLLSLTAPSAGVVTRCLVAEADSVIEGQPIAEISARLDSAALGDTHVLIDAQLHEQKGRFDADLAGQSTLASQQQQDLDARKATLSQQLDVLDSQREMKGQQVTSAAALIERIRPLRDKGVLGAFEWDQRESALLDARVQLKGIVLQRLEIERELGAVRGELDRLPLTVAARRNEIERKLADVAQAIARNEAESAVVIRAPRSGTISGLTAVQGQTMDAGQRLASLIPSGSTLQAELWIPSRAVGFVATGDAVVLRYRAYPYQQFGSRKGRVIEVGESALSPPELDQLRGRRSDEPMYRVTVALDSQNVVASGRPLPLRASMAVDADILMDRQRLIDWILTPFYGTSGPSRDVRASSVGPA